MELIEQRLICPFCGEAITMLVDVSVNSQKYIEDCEVCCRPIEIGYRAEGGQLLEFNAQQT